MPLPSGRLDLDLARLLRSERTATGWTQAQLGEAIGVSQSLVSRYETATALHPRVDVYTRAFIALDVPVDVTARRTRESRRHDRGHAYVLAYVLRRIPAEWLADTEVAVREGLRSGWIDLLLFHPHFRLLIVVEIKTEIHDVGETLRTLRWHAARALVAASERGWRPARVVAALVVLLTGETDQRIRETYRVLRSALPGDGRSLLALLAAGATREHPEPNGHLALVDPMSRRRNWLLGVSPGGRQRKARWDDYAGFVRAIGDRGSRGRPGRPGRRGRMPTVHTARA